MIRDITIAEDSCLKYHHAVAIPIDDSAQRVDSPALISPDDPAGKPVSRKEKTEQSLEEQRELTSDKADTKDDGSDAFPEGGARAWSVTAGSFCGNFAVFGIINTTAVFQEYFSTHQLSGYSPGQIGWIFSLSLFLTFFCGNPIGPVFDAKGPRVLVFGGSILLVASMMLLGLCTST